MRLDNQDTGILEKLEPCHGVFSFCFPVLSADGLCRLWRNQGKQDESRELVAPLYGWFTEGFDKLDLKEAKALLEELAS